jgi:hypothetical protein
LAFSTCDVLLLSAQLFQLGSLSRFATGVKIGEDCRLPLATEPVGLRVLE